MPDTTQAKGWRPSRTQKIVAALLLLIAWTAVANSWTEKGCTLPQGYVFVVTHSGSPDRDQGCEDEPGGSAYTDRYYG
ncbi:hypothetical protein AB9Q10_41945 [Streptomyces krungchingensis]|uniref:hypothetical protein n=1 Tax=Streptomyces krungchingensis TaxID=1565034 RepID=UPI003CEA263F